MTLADEILADTPDLYWKLDETETAASVYDYFDRDPTFTTLGTSDSGHTWTPRNSAVFGIGGSHNAYTPTPTSLANATIDHGTANVDLSVSLATSPAGNNLGLVLRYSNDSNWWRVVQDSSNIYLEKNVAGVISTVAFTSSSFFAGNVIRVVASGSSWTVYVNGVSKLTATDSFNSTATHHGIHFQNTTTIITAYRNAAPNLVATDSSGNGRHGDYRGLPRLGYLTGPACDDTTNIAPFVDWYSYITRAGLYTGDPTVSISVWFYVDPEVFDGSSVTRAVIAGFRDNTSLNGSMIITILGNKGMFCRWGASSESVVPLGTLRANCWTHYAVTHVSGSTAVKHYINGSLIYTQTITTPTLTLQPVRVGFDERGTNESMLGSIAHFAVYPTELSAARIAAHRSAGCTCADLTTPPLRLTPRDDDLVGGAARLKPNPTSRQRSNRLGPGTYWFRRPAFA